MKTIHNKYCKNEDKKIFKPIYYYRKLVFWETPNHCSWNILTSMKFIKINLLKKQFWIHYKYKI